MTWHHAEVEANEIQGNLLSHSCQCHTYTSTTDEPVDMEIDSRRAVLLCCTHSKAKRKMK